MKQGTLFGEMNRCKISVENGMLVLSTPYEHHLVEQVKALPYSERRYDPGRKVWLVDPKHSSLLVFWIDMYFGEVMSLPTIPSVTNQTVTQIFRVRYIGACKFREDGSSAAFGLVDSDWKLIFPETCLKAWFDSGDLVPEPTLTQNLYQVLGVKKTASQEEIRNGFRRMALQWHPDKCKEPNATEVFIRIKEASDILSDQNKRARYDAGLALQSAYEKSIQNKNDYMRNLQAQPTGYRSPLRCGLIMVEGMEKVGRVEIRKILAWEDIVDSAGRTLVVSWPMGAKEPVEVWA